MTGRWRPSASLDVLRARADLLARLRRFFADRGVLEVDTPMLSAHATVDLHIESFRTADGRWLHTSPEFAMKRLLAAGSGPIYQLCHVFRAGDLGRHHNPEFLMLEWYRPGWDAARLMDEVAELLVTAGAPRPRQRLTYAEAWRSHTGLDPFTAGDDELRRRVAGRTAIPDTPLDRDGWLDLGMGCVVGPRLGHEEPCFVHDFPASQAALARVRPGTPPVAERFELFWKGQELANGFQELTDAVEQRARFHADQERRRATGRTIPPCDEHLIAALHAGMPDCAGVALGVDRLLMLLLDLPELASTMPFDWSRA